MIPCELDLISTLFSNTKILAYEIYLPPSGNKISLNLLYDEYFTIPFVNDTISNSPSGHQLPTQSKLNVWIVAFNGEDPITAQGALDELNCYKTPRGKFKVKISMCTNNSYQRTYL